jgi:hypothetical protein
MKSHPKFKERENDNENPAKGNTVDCPCCGAMVRATIMSDQEAIEEEIQKQEEKTKAEVMYADHRINTVRCHAFQPA